MRNEFTTPKLDYIVFELISIETSKYQDSESNPKYEAKELETVYLAVMPEQIDYKIAGRDALFQSQSNVFITRFDYAPQRGRLSGTFGVDNRLMAGTYMSGWDRLKQFERTVVQRSKEVTEKTVLALNYYDFTHQKYGNININNFDINSNARTNSRLTTYNLDFIIIGDLITSDMEDYLLIVLDTLFGREGVIQIVLDIVNNLLSSWAVQNILAVTEIFNLTNQVLKIVAGVVSTARGTYAKVTNLF